MTLLFFEDLNVESGLAIGPSALGALAAGEILPLPNVPLVVPASLLRLARQVHEGSAAHRQFLQRLIRHFDRSPILAVDGDGEYQSQQVAQWLLRMQRDERLLLIEDNVVSNEIATLLEPLHAGAIFEIALSPKRNFLRDYVVTLYSWCLSNRAPFLERSRRLLTESAKYLATLELPHRTDRLVKAKQAVTGRLFAFPGGATTKFFLGVVVSMAGFTCPIAGVGGVLIAFADP